MKNFLKKFGPLLLTVGGAVAAGVSPALQAAVASHKGLAVGLVIASNVLHSVLPGIFGGQNQAGQ